MQSKKPLDFWLRKAGLLLFGTLIVATISYGNYLPAGWMLYQAIFMLAASAAAAVIAMVDLIELSKNSDGPFQIHRKMVAARAQMRTEMPEGDSVVTSVIDRSRRADLWRGYRHVITRRWEAGAGLLFFALSVPSILIFLIDQLPGYISPEVFLELSGTIFFAWFLLLAFLLQSLMLRFYPTSDSVRVTTVTLTRMGLHKVTPQRSVFMPWNMIESITTHEGDVYFGGIGLGCITRNAFTTTEEADDFVRKAMSLKDDALFFPAPGAWPPPPRLDHDA